MATEVSNLACLTLILAAAVVGPLACDGGSRLGIAVDSYVPVDDADTTMHVDTENGDTSEHHDTIGADTALDTLSLVDCLGGESCGDQAYCSYPDGHCRPVTAQCENGWCILPAARFMMGSDGMRGPVEHGFEATRHPVILTHRIRVMATEVTTGQWQFLLGPLAKAPFPDCGLDCPATGGTTTGKLAFANALSVSQGLEGCYELDGCDGQGDQLLCDHVTYKGLLCRGYRLPTEAESEFASRAGQEFCFDPSAPGLMGDRAAWRQCTFIPELADREWYCANSDVTYVGGKSCDDQTPGHQWRRCGPHPVGVKLPNGFGLFDSWGNVSELTTTILHEYPSSLEIDPGHSQELPNDQSIVYHGGGWAAQPLGICPTFRGQLFPLSDTSGYTGFRLVQTLFDDD